MRAVFVMTFNDLRIFLSQPGNWVGLLLLPVLFTVGLGFAFGSDSGPERVRVDVIDEDKTARSTHLLEEMVARNDTLLLCPLDIVGANNLDNLEEDAEDPCGLEGEPLTLASGQERVREGGSAALLVIPAGYGEALSNLDEVLIPYYSAAAAMTPDPVRQTLDAILLQVNSAALTAGVVDIMLDRVSGQSAAIDPWQATFVRAVYTKTETLLGQRAPAVRYVTTGGAERNEGIEGFSQSVPGVGSMYVMFTIFGGMALLQRERQRWTLQRLAVFPLTRGQILGGKILTYFTLGMLQYLIVFAVGLAVGLDFGPNPFLVLPVMAAFVLCCTAFTFAIAPSLASEMQAGVVAQLLSLSFAALGGAWWPLEIVPESMQVAGHLTPVAWVMDAFQDLLFYGGGLYEVLPELAVLLAAAGVLFVISIWRFRYV